MNSGRLVISNEQKVILLTFYENGMISTKREMGSTIRECAAQTGLSEAQVKPLILLPQSIEENIMRIHLEFFDKYITAVQDLISIMHEFKIIK